MKQVLQHARTGEIGVAEVPAPQLLPNSILVRVAASVVSAGTERASAEFAAKNLLQKAQARPDLVRDVLSKIRRDGFGSAIQAVRGRLDQPQTPGYSVSGTVIAVAEDIPDLQPGDRVSCAGANIAVHAEVVCIPRLLAARIPVVDSVGDEVAFEEAAFATLGAVALHAIRVGEAKLGDTVAVVGLGLLGQLTVQLLKAAGCRVLGMDIDQARTDLARNLGADASATDISEFRDLCLYQTRGAGADSVIIAAETPSSAPVNLAGAIARDRAIVVALGTVGIDIERKNYYEKELDFRISRSYGPGRYDSAYEQKGRDYPIGYVRWSETRNMEAFLRLLADRKIRVAPLITHRFPIERAQSAYELITGKTNKAFLGVVIQYPEIGDESRTLQLVQKSVVSAKRAASSEINVGLLGAGIFATGTLLPALQASPNTNLIGVCASTGVHAHHAAKTFRFRYATTDEAHLIADPSVNTVVIATRHHLHARQVRASLKAGKNTFCEKPLCLSEQELRELVRAYRSAGEPPRLMVGFNRRFAPMTARLKTFLASIAEPLALHYRVNAGFLAADHWANDPEQGGGRVLGEVCHFVDLLMFLAGLPVTEVEARALHNAGRYTGDNVIANLRFANGSHGVITYLANGDRSYSKERLEVFGGGSVAVLEDFRCLQMTRNGRTETLRSRWRQDKGHAAEWEAFTSAVGQGSDVPIPFQEIVCSTLTTLRLQHSIAAGKAFTVDTDVFMAEALAAPDPGE